MRLQLPPPEKELQAHSRKLQAHILAELKEQGGWIPFSRYMELCLYAPGLGYYSAGLHKFGREGDFVTAPELGELFGTTLAQLFLHGLERLGGGCVLEVGGGSGRLAATVLREMARRNRLPERWYMLERSADLRQRQKAFLQQHIPDLVQRIHWLDEPPADLPQGIVYANEVLDALPVEMLRREGDDTLQLGVIEQTGKLQLHWRRAGAELAQTFRARTPAIKGYTSEICPMLPAWVQALGKIFRQGYWLFSDYGYPRQAYYHPQRTGGTLQCHYRHRAHSDPLFWPGLQDITAHVDFDALAEACVQAGLKVERIEYQGSFLLEHGLLQCAERQLAEADDERKRLEIASEIKQLTLPGEMGERFLFLLASRLQDKARP